MTELSLHLANGILADLFDGKMKVADVGLFAADMLTKHGAELMAAAPERSRPRFRELLDELTEVWWLDEDTLQKMWLALADPAGEG